MSPRKLAVMWRWHQIEWPQLQTLAGLTIDAPGAEGCVSTYNAVDRVGSPIGPIYYIGDAGHMRRATSQEDALAHPCAFASADEWRFDEPPYCRFVRIYHRRADGQPYTIRDISVRHLSSD